jgi:hypothetical protein
MEETEEKIKKTLRRLVVTLGWERECGNAQDPVRWGGGGGVWGVLLQKRWLLYHHHHHHQYDHYFCNVAYGLGVFHLLRWTKNLYCDGISVCVFIPVDVTATVE